jgi:hypothetical protein
LSGKKSQAVIPAQAGIQYLCHAGLGPASISFNIIFLDTGLRNLKVIYDRYDDFDGDS